MIKKLNDLNEWFNRKLEQRIANSIFVGGGLGNVRLRQKIISWIRQNSSGNIILDVGGGDCKWQKFFKGDQHYFCADYPLTVSSCPWREAYFDLAADGHKLPIQDNSCDLVLCLFVLEHVTNPQQLISELARIVKKNGRIILAGPGDLCLAHGMPYNYFNLTIDGYSMLFRQNGLNVEEEYIPLKFWGTIVQLIYLHIVRHLGYNRSSFLKLLQLIIFLLSLPLMPVINLMAAVVDAIIPFDRRGYSTYAAYLKKL